MSFTGPTCQLRAFRFRSRTVSWLALRFGIPMRNTLGCKGALGVVRSESVLLLHQGVELLLDSKVGLGVDNRPGGGILVWESGKELFEEHFLCKCMFEVIICCYNSPPCLFERNPCIFDLGVLWELECCDLCNVLSVCLQSDLTVFLVQLVPLFFDCSKLADEVSV